MLQLIKCMLCIVLLLVIFSIWGYSIAWRLKISVKHLPMQILVGFFGFFIVMEVVILPVVFLHNSLDLATGLVVSVIVAITAWMLWRDKLGFLQNIKRISITPWLVVVVVIVCFMMVLSVLQQYLGYDTCFYIGSMNSTLYYGEFWTHDAMGGLVESTGIPLHYALSCFYPLGSVLAYLFHVDARLMAMYTIRALCVLLFGCVAYSWGYGLFGCRENHVDVSLIDENGVERTRQRNGALFTIICMILCMFLMDDHSSSFMMIVRGYESKGYCAAIVAPMCAYALIQLCRDVESISNWRLLGLIAWASMPIAMSSMAVIPVAIAVVGLVLMICHKQIGMILRRCIYCVLPNMILMVWYVLGTYLPGLKG